MTGADLPERVMVCMSSNPDAPRVIATAARMARRLRGPWFAVYVETPREHPGRISQNDLHALAANVAMAQHLGATIVRVKAPRAVDGLIEFARREGMTHVVFGETQRSLWELLIHGSILDRFQQEVPDTAVHVVGAESDSM